MGFLTPAIIEQYAKESVTLNVSSISVESFTSEGLQARVKADVMIDAGRVKSGFVRAMGRIGTSVAKKVSTAPGEVHVFLPDYDNVLLGKVLVPTMVLDIRNGYTNELDFVSDVVPGEMDGVRKVVDDFIAGKVKKLRVWGWARLDMRSGILPLGRQLLSETLTFESLSPYTSPKAKTIHFLMLQSE